MVGAIQMLTSFGARMEASLLGTPVVGSEQVVRHMAIVQPAHGFVPRQIAMHPLDVVEFRAGRDIDARIDGVMAYLVAKAHDRLDEAAERLRTEHD